MHEYFVWGVPPNKKAPVNFGSFEPSRWQWAEKLAAFLRDRGYTDVEVVLEEVKT